MAAASGVGTPHVDFCRYLWHARLMSTDREFEFWTRPCTCLRCLPPPTRAELRAIFDVGPEHFSGWLRGERWPPEGVNQASMVSWGLMLAGSFVAAIGVAALAIM